ncbi:helix-turn-helix domain-containing protein [Amycolatopsis sp. H20-H5]|uniref:helix-turn-helix domain-containing protein n=1 Tax=Amycolatopsis sp. H20-H5 TaxID=3046309 RepID=UPI003FA3A452
MWFLNLEGFRLGQGECDLDRRLLPWARPLVWVSSLDGVLIDIYQHEGWEEANHGVLTCACGRRHVLRRFLHREADRFRQRAVDHRCDSSGDGRCAEAAARERTSIRVLAESAGRFYGFIHRVLAESGAAMRSRGGGHRKSPSPRPVPS